MSEKQFIGIINAVNYFKIKSYLTNLYGFPMAFAGGSTMISEIYSGGVALKSSKNHIWEKEFNKEEIIIPEHVGKDISNKLIELAQAT